MTRDPLFTGLDRARHRASWALAAALEHLTTAARHGQADGRDTRAIAEAWRHVRRARQLLDQTED